jgi:hypothetical protein
MCGLKRLEWSLRHYGKPIPNRAMFPPWNQWRFQSHVYE